MFLITSPSKTQDFSPMVKKVKTSIPMMKNHINEIVRVLKLKTKNDIASLMKISEKLAELNFIRFKAFSNDFSELNSKPALFAFQGDVYSGIQVEGYSAEELDFAQKHLRIISGLYGILKPLDLMQAYRLEMGTKLSVGSNQNLYEFWGDKISHEINKDISKDSVVLNLASKEYSQAVDIKSLEAKMVNVDFKENKSGAYKTVGLFAKRARGKMINFIIKNKLDNVDSIKQFNIDGYKFNEEMSDEYNICFTR